MPKNIKQDYQITTFCRRSLIPYIEAGSLCIDATMGNGNDTLFLCQQAGPTGTVLAFDIQSQALEHTEKLLKEELPYVNYRLYQDSHANLSEYVKPGSVDAIMFNLGYLPAGDHKISTKPDTTLSALSASLDLIRQGGAISLCIYSGGDSGFEEKDAVLSFLQNLDPKKYLVLLTHYYNRPHNPPIPALILKK